MFNTQQPIKLHSLNKIEYKTATLRDFEATSYDSLHNANIVKVMTIKS